MFKFNLETKIIKSRLYIGIIFITILNCVSCLSIEQICENEKSKYTDQKRYINNLKIVTFQEYNDDSNFLEKEVPILSDCETSHNWNYNLKPNFYENKEQVFEAEKVNRRSFRILNKFNDLNFPITINSIQIEQNNQPKLTTPVLPYQLKSGAAIDFFIDYNCNKSNLDFYNLVIKIVLNKDIVYEYSYKKICSNGNQNYSNSTYLLLIIMFIILSYLCEQDYLTLKVHIVLINLEDIIAVKYAEVITIYLLILISIFVLLGILTLFKAFAYSSGVLLSLISIKFILKALISFFLPELSKIISQKVWILNDKYNVTLTLSKVIYYIIAIVIFFFWMIFFNNFFLMNFIAFSISYLVIKKFHFRNFYFLIVLFYSVILYNLIWLAMYSSKYSDTFNLSSENIVNIPIIFFLPEIIESAFQTNYFFSLTDLILIGFLLEYLKNSNNSGNLDYDYLKYTRYAMYSGLGINIISFYFLKLCLPFFLLPGLLSMTYLIIESYRQKDLIYLVHLDKTRKRIGITNNQYPLQIIGADQSDCYNEFVANKKYIPPNIICEMESLKEESPREKILGNINENR